MNRRSIFSLFVALPFVPKLVQSSEVEVPGGPIHVDLTAAQWHLFTTKPGVEGAAKALNRAVNNAIVFCASPESAYEFMKPVLARFKEFGAQDTEPRDFTLQPLLRVAFRSNYNLLFGRDHSNGPRS